MLTLHRSGRQEKTMAKRRGHLVPAAVSSCNKGSDFIGLFLNPVGPVEEREGDLVGPW